MKGFFSEGVMVKDGKKIQYERYNVNVKLVLCIT